jgi:branched-chain amino acid transport system permease protein
VRRRGRGKIDFTKDMAIIGSRRQWLVLAAFLALLLALPQVLRLVGGLNWVTFLNFTFIIIIAVLGLNVITGMAGQISLGHSAFIMVGGYTFAILTTQSGWPFWVAALAATLITAVVGMLVAAPAIRLKGFYVAIVTLAFFFIAQHVIKNLEIAGGINGLAGVPYPTIGGIRFTDDITWYYLILAFTVACITASVNLSRSRLGRAFLAMRDNEIIASSLGVNVPLTKLRVFFVGSLFAGLAGVLGISYVSVIRLDQFTIWDSIWYLGMIIIGGVGSTAGTVMGVTFLQLVRQILHVISISGWIPLGISLSVSLTFAFYGLAIILFMVFQPHGLIAVWHKIRINYKRWPFRD